jgi:tetratricopeptide (TPR) repeat protein
VDDRPGGVTACQEDAMADLKMLSHDAIPSALARAERYRLLNQPSEAESICHDVLLIEPDNQDALVALVLALTDQFPGDLARSVTEARQAHARLHDEYARAYYSGLICERRAKAHLQRSGPGADAAAYEYFTEALGHYDRAEALRPPGNDDALLRWNACVRALQRHPRLAEARDERFEPYLE